MNISRLQPVFSETWIKSLKTSVKLHLHQPREPVQNISTELCEAGPDRGTALHEAKEASADELSRQPQNKWAESSQGDSCDQPAHFTDEETQTQKELT